MEVRLSAVQFSFGSDGGDGVQLVFFFLHCSTLSFSTTNYLKHFLHLVKSFVDFFPLLNV